MTFFLVFILGAIKVVWRGEPHKFQLVAGASGARQNILHIYGEFFGGGVARTLSKTCSHATRLNCSRTRAGESA
jgi:hypothetical protein